LRIVFPKRSHRKTELYLGWKKGTIKVQKKALKSVEKEQEQDLRKGGEEGNISLTYY